MPTENQSELQTKQRLSMHNPVVVDKVVRAFMLVLCAVVVAYFTLALLGADTRQGPVEQASIVVAGTL